MNMQQAKLILINCFIFHFYYSVLKDLLCVVRNLNNIRNICKQKRSECQGSGRQKQKLSLPLRVCCNERQVQQCCAEIDLSPDWNTVCFSVLLGSHFGFHMTSIGLFQTLQFLFKLMLCRCTTCERVFLFHSSLEMPLKSIGPFRSLSLWHNQVFCRWQNSMIRKSAYPKAAF